MMAGTTMSTKKTTFVVQLKLRYGPMSTTSTIVSNIGRLVFSSLQTTMRKMIVLFLEPPFLVHFGLKEMV
jgi:uncharacterized membrane protein